MIFLGVEYGAKYTLEGPNGIKAVFNDSTDADYVGDLSPESSGLDAPEVREDSADRVEADGAIFGDFFAGKRPVILQGTIIATSKAQRNERVGKLRAASNGKTTDMVLWWEDAAAGKLRINLRRQQPLRVTKGWVKEFQLSLVAADSRILSYTPSSVTGEKITLSSSSKFPLGVQAEIYKEYTGTWINILNTKVEDGVFATSAAQNPRLIFATNFGFSIPANAAINGIEVLVKGKGSVADNYIWNITAISAQMTNFIPAFEEAIKNGDSSTSVVKFSATNEVRNGFVTNRLGAGASTVVPALVNTSSFGVAIGIQGGVAGTLSLDDINVIISYAVGPELKVTNNGNVSAPTKIIISSGTFLSRPIVTNLTTGESFAYSGALETGRKLIIDTEAFTVIEEGTGITGHINRYNNIIVGSAWPQVMPGENIFAFGAAESLETGSKHKFQVEWRNAWE